MNSQTDGGRGTRVPVVTAVPETRYARHGLPHLLVDEQDRDVLDVRIH